jgi:DHA2 family methylenomycin A resistance protein-like MFS transporter
MRVEQFSQGNAGTRKPERHWLALSTLCLAVLVAQVDTSVVNLAVRPIGAHFDAGVAALQWVIDSYNLAYAVLLLTGGLLADLYGRRLIFITGAAIFTAASIVAGLSPDISVLISGRTLTGIGAALLLPASLALVRVIWRDEKERARALGIWAACNGLAFAIGPTLGGFLIRWFGWRSVFFVVVPFGVAAMAMALRALPESSDSEGRHFDAPAQVLGALALGGIAFAAIESHGTVWLAAAGLLMALAALPLFIVAERKRGSAALVPLDMFKVRCFVGAVTATAGMTFGMYGVIFLMPLVWQSTEQLDAVGAGIALLPMALIFVLVSPFSGSLRTRFGTRLVTAGGVAIIGAGLLTVAVSSSVGSLVVAEIGLALTGLGMGFATGPLMGAAVDSFDSGRSGTAAALINVARMAGATIGVAILGAIFAHAGAGETGLQVAMIVGGVVQITAAAIAWKTVTPAS